MDSKQTQAWLSGFGKEYTDRNDMTLQEMDGMYVKRYGCSRTDMNRLFLEDLRRDIKILEVGSNIGLQLLFLQYMGFRSLYGIELLDYAVEQSKKRTVGINIIQGNALDIPFKDNYFDLVFTSGLLIHIDPCGDLFHAMREIRRCTKRYIWGFEYHAVKTTPIDYRGSKELLWKANYPLIYCGYFADLIEIQKELYKYEDSENRDVMFLLEKK